MEFESYAVYVKTNEAGYITAVNSSGFIADVTGWTKIDEGSGDRYHHAQGHYFADTVATEAGAFRYKLINGMVAECTDADIAAQEAAMKAENTGSAAYDNVWDELDAAYQEGVDSV